MAALRAMDRPTVQVAIWLLLLSAICINSWRIVVNSQRISNNLASIQARGPLIICERQWQADWVLWWNTGHDEPPPAPCTNQIR